MQVIFAQKHLIQSFHTLNYGLPIKAKCGCGEKTEQVCLWLLIDVHISNEMVNLTQGQIHVKGYLFLSFTKNMYKTLSSEYGQKPLQNTKTSATDALKTA